MVPGRSDPVVGKPSWGPEGAIIKVVGIFKDRIFGDLVIRIFGINRIFGDLVIWSFGYSELYSVIRIFGGVFYTLTRWVGGFTQWASVRERSFGIVVAQTLIEHNSLIEKIVFGWP